MTIRIRKAQSKDVQQLAELARVGYASSPVYRFVRTHALEFPKDTEKSYRNELRVLIENPKLMVDVLEVEVDIDNNNELGKEAVHLMRNSHVSNTEPNCDQRIVQDWSDFKVCNDANKTRPPRVRRIVGFAIWRLGTHSGMIHRSFLKDISYICVSARAKFTSFFWKSRDSDPVRAKKIGKLCHRVQTRFFREDPDCMELEQMVVHPDFQRQRYGTKLGEKGLGIAREEGRPVWVIATPMGEKLYETLGFARKGGAEAEDGAAKCSLAVQVWRAARHHEDSDSDSDSDSEYEVGSMPRPSRSPANLDKLPVVKVC